MSVKKMQFQTEVSQLLNLVIHSLYSNQEIFMRELISNASDAIDKAKYEGIIEPKIYEGGTDWAIKLIVDEDAGTLTVSDNGIGMSKDEVVQMLGTIAHSGTKEFLKKITEAKDKGGDIANLIGQFGVGFYSAFMVAGTVQVVTRKRGTKANSATKWVSDAGDSYTIETVTKDTVGTDIVLTLKEDTKKYLDEWVLRRIVTSYSDYIEYPIQMDIESPVMGEDEKPTDEKEIKTETLNSQKAIWLKDRAEVTDEEQNEFYKHISRDFSDPARTIHIKAEGMSEFYAMLFIPSMQPFDLFNKDMKYGPMLYVKRVQIMENCEELVPPYLRFIKGVVDSSDLPLNVSREILQNNRQISIMQKNITRRTLDTLAEMQRDTPEQYAKFFEEFGMVLKEGIHYDQERAQKIAELCIFESSTTKEGQTTTFDEYSNRMKSEQKEIFYITGGSRKELENSPYIETLLDDGIEVLYMTGEIDDIIFSTLGVFKEKPLKSVLKGVLDSVVPEEKSKEYNDLVSQIKSSLGDKVADVRLTNRLKNSAVCLVTTEGAPDPQMERLLKAMGQPVPKAQRTLEINPDHALLAAMKGSADKDKIKEYSELLYAQAVLLEGGKLEDISSFVQKVTNMMTKGL